MDTNTSDDDKIQKITLKSCDDIEFRVDLPVARVLLRGIMGGNRFKIHNTKEASFILSIFSIYSVLYFIKNKISIFARLPNILTRCFF